eukprot:TRINITY_DN4259_c0_g1_i3.p1 TRINITY_DN4259_c0_g1~~TRINITY_DN4259_c0_g1_i3.p1  ORF type:complete len:149 (-),score=36.05 TRINITY_DN4259_c0_g1_i3:138-584(-)
MGNRQQLKAEATTQKMITSISSIFWGEHSEPNTESEHTEDESSDDEEWVVVGPSSKAVDTPDTALYYLPPGDPAFTVMDNPPLPTEVSQEVILLIERIKNGRNNAGLSEVGRHTLGGTGRGRKALKGGNLTRGSWMNKHCFCKNIKQC